MQKNAKKYLPVIIFVLVVIIIVVIAFIVTDKSSSNTAENISKNNVESQKTQLPEENNDAIENIDQKWSKGNPNGKIQVIEYSDFQCPYCKKGSDIIEKIFQKYKDNMQITFVHFPLTSIHPYALPSAKAAEAAGYQGKFWEMHDLLFANQKNLTTSDIETYAKKIGLDMDRFNKFLNNKNINAKIEKQMKEIEGKEFDEIALDEKGNVVSKGKAKIEGTPAFLVNGKLVVGAYPEEAFDKIIQNALSTAK